MLISWLLLCKRLNLIARANQLIEIPEKSLSIDMHSRQIPRILFRIIKIDYDLNFGVIWTPPHGSWITGTDNLRRPRLILKVGDKKKNRKKMRESSREKMSNDGFWEVYNARVNSSIITLSQLLIFFMTDELSIFTIYLWTILQSRKFHSAVYLVFSSYF